MILFGLGIVDEWIAFKESFDLFCSTIGMSVSTDKYSFLYNDVDEETRRHIFAFLPYRMDPISTGFKYLGYHIKSLGYHTKYWRWIVSMFESRIKKLDL